MDTLINFIDAIQKNIPGIKIGIPYEYCFSFSPGAVDIDPFNNILQDPATQKVTAFFVGQFTYSIRSTTPLNILRLSCKNNGSDECTVLTASRLQDGNTAPLMITNALFENLESGIVACLTVTGWIIPIKLPF